MFQDQPADLIHDLAKPHPIGFIFPVKLIQIHARSDIFFIFHNGDPGTLHTIIFNHLMLFDLKCAAHLHADLFYYIFCKFLKTHHLSSILRSVHSFDQSYRVIFHFSYILKYEYIFIFMYCTFMIFLLYYFRGEII